MTETSTSFSMRNQNTVKQTTIHPQNYKPSVEIGVCCRTELQSNFDAAEKEAREKSLGKKFVYPRCSTCKDRAPGRLRKFAVSVCNECNVYLCIPCTRKHRNTYGHMQISAISPKQDEEKHYLTRNGHHVSTVCHEGHKDIPKYFCETCQDIVCLECIETRHKKHEFVYAKDAYGKHKETLEKYIENAHVEADRIVKQLDQGEKITSDLKTEKEEIAKKIKTQTELIMEVLRKREKDLLEDLETIYSNKNDVLVKSKERLNNRLELIKRTCRFTEIAMKDGDDIQLLIFEKYARKRLEELCCAEFLIHEETEGTLRYVVVDGSLEKAEELLGKVVCSAVEPNQCEAWGEGLRRAVVAQDSCFTVKAKDKDGTPLITGGDDVQAQMTSCTRDEESFEVRVTDQGNGTYTVKYSPKTSGILKVGVRVYGEPIKTPDCEVHVVCQRDYEKIQKPLLAISRLILSGKESTLKLPCGVAIDNEGRILVADCHNHSIKTFTKDGRFIKSFGCFGSKNGQLNSPTDVAVYEEMIYVSDKDNSRVQCFTPEGAFLRKFSRGCCQLKRPWGICIDSKGNVVVADTKNNQIQVFSKDGHFVASFGREGSGESEFRQPYFVAVNSSGRIYITDSGNHRVQVFDEEYSYLFQFCGGYDEFRMKYPTGITIDHEGDVIVADQCNNRLQVYQANGKHKAVISNPLNALQCPSFPKGVAVTQDGYIVVADSDNDKVVLL